MNQIALPHNENFPAIPDKRSLVAHISFAIAGELGEPEIQARFREPSKSALRIGMAMEKATVDEYDLATAREHKVRPPR
jgi:hypothetical protein